MGIDVALVQAHVAFILKKGTCASSAGGQAKAFPHLQAQANGEFDIEEFDRDMVTIGTPDECLEKIRKSGELGVGETKRRELSG